MILTTTRAAPTWAGHAPFSHCDLDDAGTDGTGANTSSRATIYRIVPIVNSDTHIAVRFLRRRP